jgi:hypothetical protein
MCAIWKVKLRKYELRRGGYSCESLILKMASHTERVSCPVLVKSVTNVRCEMHRKYGNYL